MRILYIDIDTLRPDHLGCYGYHRDTSPNIDKLAEQGVRFENCYVSDSPCLPSRAALYSGKCGIRNGALNHGGARAEMHVDPKTRLFRWPHDNYITRLRKARMQVSAVAERLGDDAQYADLAQAATAITENLDGIEEALYQTKLEARQDPLNFPIRLNDKLAGVMYAASIGDHAPTASAIAVRDELVAAINEQLAALDVVLGERLDAFNAQVAQARIPAVAIGTE